jgi:Uma2 family endonuclease
MGAAETLALTYEAYLTLERETGVRHELVGGFAYAMAGGTPAHGRVAMAVGALLFNLARPGRGRCRVYSADGKIHVPARGNSYHPDVSVVCGPLETARQDPNAIVNPTLLVEVLSEGTEAADRGRTFLDYQTLPSLRTYLLVSPDEHRIELFRRNVDESWTLTVLRSGDDVILDELGGSFAVDEAYIGEETERAAPGG